MKYSYIAIFVSLVISVSLIFVDHKVSNLNAEISSVTVNIYRSPWPGFMLIELANVLGYFKEEGIVINDVNSETIDEMYDLFKAGKLDVAAESLSDLYIKSIEDPSLKVKAVMVTDYSNGADGVLSRVGAPQFFGTSTIKIAGDENYRFYFAYILNKAQIDTKLFKHIDIPDDEDKVRQLLQGKIDYVMTFEPYLSEGVSGGAVLVHSSKEEPGIVLDGIIFNNNFISEYPDKVIGFIRAYFKAYSTWINSPDESYKLVQGFLQSNPESIKNNMSRIIMLDLDDNVNSMSNQQGLISIYNHLMEAQKYAGSNNINSHLKASDVVYPEAIRKIKRDNDLNIYK